MNEVLRMMCNQVSDSSEIPYGCLIDCGQIGRVYRERQGSNVTGKRQGIAPEDYEKFTHGYATGRLRASQRVYVTP